MTAAVIATALALLAGPWCLAQLDGLRSARAARRRAIEVAARARTAVRWQIAAVAVLVLLIGSVT